VYAPLSRLRQQRDENSGLGGGASGIRTLGDLSDSIAGIRPEFGSLFGPEREDLNQREFLGFDLAYRISLVPFMPDVIGDAFITSNIIELWTATFGRPADCQHQGENRRRSRRLNAEPASLSLDVPFPICNSLVLVDWQLTGGAKPTVLTVRLDN
jgi:hypothetical protein